MVYINSAAIIELYYDENTLHFRWDDNVDVRFVPDQHA